MVPSDNFRFYTILGAVFGGGAVAIFLWTHFEWPGRETAIAISHAVMIAAFLAATVDSFLKERLLKEISRDASKYLIGYGLPPQVQNRIRELMCTSLIRSQFEARYHVKDVAGETLVDVEHSFQLENYSTHDEKHTAILTLAAAEHGEVHEMACLTQDPDAAYSLTPVPRRRTGENDSFRGKEIVVHPRQSRRIYRIFVRYTMKPLNPTEVLAFAKMTNNVTLIATGDGYEFTSDSIAATNATSNGRWEYNQLFMPGEHLRLNWKRAGCVPIPPSAS